MALALALAVVVGRLCRRRWAGRVVAVGGLRGRRVVALLGVVRPGVAVRRGALADLLRLRRRRAPGGGTGGRRAIAVGARIRLSVTELAGGRLTITGLTGRRL